MRYSFLVFLLVLLSPLFLSAKLAEYDEKPILEHNGYWWDEQSELLKLGYLMGVHDAYLHSYLAFQMLFCGAPGDSGPCFKDKIECEVSALMGHTFFRRSLWELEAATLGQLEEGLDELSLDYKNKQIPIIHMIELASMESVGNTKAEIDSVARILRQIRDMDDYLRRIHLDGQNPRPRDRR